MKMLYLDNFKGFSESYIPLLDVNFLVGENSTGKTTFLDVLHLLSSFEFWLQNDFNPEDFELGNFSNIVSLDSDKNHFRIGFLKCEAPDEVDRSKVTGVVITYINRGGLPSVARYQYITKDQVGDIRFTPKQTKFKEKKFEQELSTEDEILAAFYSLTRDTYSDKRGYKTLHGAKEANKYPPNRRLFLLRMIGETPNEADLIPISTPINNTVWMSPIRSEPKRIYVSYKFNYTPTGEHTPYLIRQMLSKQRSQHNFEEFVQNFGQASTLFDDIVVKSFTRDITSPFEIRLVLNGKQLPITDVGYGVSQALPVAVEVFQRTDRTTFLIQQPEVHLHPKAQAALGDFFFDAATSQHKSFFIETHSDFLINRFRLRQKKANTNQESQVDSQVLYFERDKEGNRIHPIEIHENGTYSEKQPSGFRDFFIQEEIRLLEI